MAEHALERRFSEEARRRFAIRSTGIDQPVRQLSGGNQQKVVFARWLAETPKVLVLYEPTKGVDVGAKTEIYRLIGELTGAGVAVVLISADMLELIGLCDRIHVLFEGAVAGSLDRPAFLRGGYHAPRRRAGWGVEPCCLRARSGPI